MKAAAARWTFSRIGGVDQVVLRDGNDVGNLKNLDHKLWAVLALPTSQPAFGECLKIMDMDEDGKVRVPDILRSVEELQAGLASLDQLFDSGDSLPVDQIVDTSAKEAVAHLLEANPQANSSNRIGLAEVDKEIEIFSSLPFNGDGVVDPACIEDSEVAGLARGIIAAGFSAGDSAGKQGLAAVSLANFIDAAKARLAWLSVEPSSQEFPIPKEERGRGYALFSGLALRLDDYFQRCMVLAMSGSDEVVVELGKVLSAIVAAGLDADGGAELEKLPIAMPRVSALLESGGAINPRDANAFSAFMALVSKPFSLGPNIGQSAWETVKKSFENYGAWVKAESFPNLASFDKDNLETILSGPELAVIGGLIEKDAAMALKADGLRALRKLIVMKRDFLSVLQNFVNLDDFYSKGKGLFRAGRLFLDGRELKLCLEVKNVANHASMAGLSAMYLIYCNLTSHSGQQKSIVAALTAGDANNIFIGRNGVFYDTEGGDWDAVITKIVVQPISIREAFFSPYKWFAKSLEDFAMKRAATAEAANMDKLKTAAATTANADKAQGKPEVAGIPKKIDVGTVAAIGVALGSIGAMVTGILGLFFGLGAWMPIGIVGVLFLISGPSMILAYMKLRKRNIGPLLNAEGWAVNGRLKINVPFGATLSHLSTLPAGSIRLVVDPFAEKKKPWGLYLAIVIVIGAAVAAYFLGWINPLLGR
ncbi:MAG: hypothetical protein NT061_09270 [Spirochaetes bacterium]|nr:hypothetical protein [Spirochaetota bacterium]